VTIKLFLRDVLNPNLPLYRLSNILSCLRCLLSIFRLLVGTLLGLFSWRSPLRLQE